MLPKNLLDSPPVHGFVNAILRVISRHAGRENRSHSQQGAQRKGKHTPSRVTREGSQEGHSAPGTVTATDGTKNQRQDADRPGRFRTDGGAPALPAAQSRRRRLRWAQDSAPPVTRPPHGPGRPRCWVGGYWLSIPLCKRCRGPPSPTTAQHVHFSKLPEPETRAEPVVARWPPAVRGRGSSSWGALGAEQQIHLIKVQDDKKRGARVGLRKADGRGKPGQVAGCHCAVVAKGHGKGSQAKDAIEEYFRRKKRPNRKAGS